MGLAALCTVLAEWVGSAALDLHSTVLLAQLLTISQMVLTGNGQSSQDRLIDPRLSSAGQQQQLAGSSSAPPPPASAQPSGSPLQQQVCQHVQQQQSRVLVDIRGANLDSSNYAVWVEKQPARRQRAAAAEAMEGSVVFLSSTVQVRG